MTIDHSCPFILLKDYMYMFKILERFYSKTHPPSPYDIISVNIFNFFFIYCEFGNILIKFD